MVTRGEGATAGKFTYTIFTLTVEKVIKGDPNTKEVFIRKPGGLSQGSSEPSFEMSMSALVGLHAEIDNIYTVLGEAGMIWLKSKTLETSPSLRDVIGLLIVSMKANNIPIALPPSEWPPLPTGPVTRPSK